MNDIGLFVVESFGLDDNQFLYGQSEPSSITHVDLTPDLGHDVSYMGWCIDTNYMGGLDIRPSSHIEKLKPGFTSRNAMWKQ